MDRRECAVVVGATGAMGQRIARRLAVTGLQVVAVARSADALAALCDPSARIEACVADIAVDAATAALIASLAASRKPAPSVTASARMRCCRP